MKIHLKRNEIDLTYPINLFISLSFYKTIALTMPPTTITEPEISISQCHHFIFARVGFRIAFSCTLICFSSSLIPGITRESLPVEVCDNGQDPDDDEINPYEIVKYLGENHYNDTENKRDYTPQ
ncbi:MAG: hypothetical protein WC294_04880 [Methanoregula sp.]|jgi:hypothetical protein